MAEKKGFGDFNMEEVAGQVQTDADKIRTAATPNTKQTPDFSMAEPKGNEGDGVRSLQDSKALIGGDRTIQGGTKAPKNDDGMTDAQVQNYSKTSEEVKAMSDEEKKKHNRIMTRQRKLRNSGIRSEAAEHELNQNEIAILQQISSVSRIIGYIMSNDQRVDVSTRSTKDKVSGTVTSRYVAVNRAPSGRIATVVKMPKAAYERLSTGVAVDSTLTFSHAELSDLGIFTIPESKLADQIGMFFGAEIFEDEAITEKYVTKGKNPTPITNPDKLVIQNKLVEPKEGANFWKFVPKFSSRKVNVNNINYIPNRRLQLVPVTGLSAEQADSLNLAAFYREECKRGKIKNPVYEAVADRIGDKDAAGVIASPDGKISSKAFAPGAGAVPDFFKEVKHWYNRNDDGSDVYLTPEQILVPDRKATITGEMKLKVSTPDVKLDASDESKSWNFDLATDFPAIAAAVAQVPGGFIDKEFIVKAIQSNRKTTVSASAPTQTDTNLTLALLRAKREGTKVFGAGYAK